MKYLGLNIKYGISLISINRTDHLNVLKNDDIEELFFQSLFLQSLEPYGFELRLS